MDIWALVSAVGRRQHMLITIWQLRLLGVSDQALAERLRSGEWRKAAPGVVSLHGAMTPLRRLAAAVLSLSAPEDAGLRVEAEVEGGATRVEAMVSAAFSVAPVVCGRSALWLHGIGSAPSRHWLRVPRKGPGSSARDGCCVRYGPRTGALHWIEGLPTVDVEQAFMDIPGAKDHPSAAWLHHDLVKLVAKADALRKTNVDTLAERLLASPRFVGRPALRRVVADLRGELSHSGAERQARRIVGEILERFELALEPGPHLVLLDGQPVGEADLAVVAIRFDVEVDGPHHLMPEQQRKDKLRDRRMRRAAWEVERFSTELIELSPARFAAEVEECLHARLKVVRRENPLPGEDSHGGAD